MNKRITHLTTIAAISLSLFLAISPSISHAQGSNQPSLNQILDQQQLPLDRILDQQKIEQQQQKLLEKPKTQDRKIIKKKSKRTSKYCVKIKSVKFLKATKLSKKAKANLTKKVLNKCIFNDQIGELLNDTTNYYIGDGYTNARAYFKDYNSKTEILTLLISEGVINSIKINDSKDNKNKKDESFLDQTQIFFAFPTRVGKIFNITDIEQGINNMNRLRSNNAVIDSRPGQDGGTSDVIINNHKKPNSLELSVNYDNSGSKSSGIYNTTYSIDKDNLFYINDNINLSQIKSDRSETNMVSLSIPFGYYLFSYRDSSNHYTSLLGKSVVEGRSTNHDIYLSRLIYRSKSSELNLSTNLSLRNQNRKVAGVVDLKSQRLSTGRVGFSYVKRLKNNLNIYSGITYSKGLKIHGAINDKKDFTSPLNKDAPRAQFDKISYNLSLYKPVTKYLDYSMQLNGQHSSDALYSSELIYIGGNQYTVRGLQYNGISGSKGGYVKNDLKLNLNHILNNYSFDKNNKLLSHTISTISKTTPYIFYDHGFARQITRADEITKTDYISGAGIGIKYYGKYITGEVSYAANINSPKYTMMDNEYQNSAIYFGISGRYWLW